VRCRILFLSFLSNHCHSPHSFIFKWCQEVFTWYCNSQRMYQTTTFSYCLGLECVGKFTPMSSQWYCGVVLMHRDNFIFCSYKTVLCPILKQWEKVLSVVRRMKVRTSHALHCIASESPLVNVRLLKAAYH
jgi:hypothetical protein